jgi:hypothetical protein
VVPAFTGTDNYLTLWDLRQLGSGGGGTGSCQPLGSFPLNTVPNGGAVLKIAYTHSPHPNMAAFCTMLGVGWWVCVDWRRTCGGSAHAFKHTWLAPAALKSTSFLGFTIEQNVIVPLACSKILHGGTHAASTSTTTSSISHTLRDPAGPWCPCQGMLYLMRMQLLSECIAFPPAQNCVCTVDWSSLQSPAFHVADLGLAFDPNGPAPAPSVIDLKWIPGQGHSGMAGLLGTSDRGSLHMWAPVP